MILAPPHCKALLPLKHLLGVWKVDGVDMLLQLERLCGEGESSVVGQVASVEIWVNVKSVDGMVLVSSRLVLVLRVPLTAAHLQLARLRSELVNALGSGEENVGVIRKLQHW